MKPLLSGILYRGAIFLKNRYAHSERAESETPLSLPAAWSLGSLLSTWILLQELPRGGGRKMGGYWEWISDTSHLETLSECTWRTVLVSWGLLGH